MRARSVARSLGPERVAQARLSAWKIGALPPALRLAPGVTLCAMIAGVAALSERAEGALIGHAWVGSLLIAIVLGAVVREVFRPGAYWQPGIDFCNRAVLEVVVVLLGASVSLSMVTTLGLRLAVAVAVVVLLVLAVGYAIGRGLGLSRGVATLVACGNAICGTSAIMAVAGMTNATRQEIASALAFTASLGIIVVAVLPVAGHVLGLKGSEYGVLAGLTVYAVPQVAAATAAAAAPAAQVGLLVKLLRVMMLSPVVALVALVNRRPGTRLPLSRIAPWFVVGFFAMALCRTLGILPPPALSAASMATAPLTLVAMAALGAVIDVPALVRAGPRIAIAAALSLGMLGLSALFLIPLAVVG